MKNGKNLIAAAVAVGAGAYYFYAGKNAKKNRQIVTTWATKMKKDVLQKAKKLAVSKKTDVYGIIDEVTNAYNSVKNIDAKDVSKVTKELKTNWDKLVKEISEDGSSVGKKIGKATNAVGKTVAKTVKKATKAGK